MPPPVRISENWLDASDPRVGTHAFEDLEWWRLFNDPILDQLIERAYRDNILLKIAALRVLEARAQLGIAVGRLYPQTQQASGSLEYNRLSDRSAQSGLQQTGTGLGSRPSGGGLGSELVQSQIGITASWEIDFWGKFRRAIESANASWLASVADYDSALVTLTADQLRPDTLSRGCGLWLRNHWV